MPKNKLKTTSNNETRVATSNSSSAAEPGGKSVKKSTIIAIVAGICALGLAIWGVTPFMVNHQAETGSRVGMRAPDFTLQTIDGKSLALSQLKGRIVMLNYWQTLSQDYAKLDQEARFIQAVRDNWPDKELAIVGIVGQSDAAAARQLATKYKFTFPILLDAKNEAAAAYDIGYSPTHFFIDRQGITRLVALGPFHRQDEIESILNKMRNKEKLESPALAISDAQASTVTDRAAVITWTTDKPATSEVRVYQAKSGMNTVISKHEEKLDTKHSLTVSGLEPSTVYSFRVFSGYRIENPIASPAYSFTTTRDVSPPQITAIDLSDVASSRPAIRWKTNEPATSEAEYQLVGSERADTATDATLTLEHSLVLDKLLTDKRYLIRVKSKDAGGYQSVIDVYVSTFSPFPIGTQVGNRAPDFTLRSLDGKNVALGDSRGKPVLLKFWITTCKTCKDEMPTIQAFYEKWSGKGPVILAVDVGESAATVQSYVDSMKLTFPILLDSAGEVDSIFRPTGFPTTFFIDGNGVIRKIKEGRFQSIEEIEAILKSL